MEPFFMELISGVEAELSDRSFALTLQIIADVEAEIAVYRRWWGERRVDGVLVCDLHVTDARIAALEELQLPTVVIGGPVERAGITTVWSDDAAALVEMLEYLGALGHRRVARVGGLPELLHTEIRTRAFESTARRLGFENAPTVVADYTGEGGTRATRRLLSSPRRPTAIVYDNDVMAIAGLAVAQEMGFHVPADLSIVAWDDSPLCRLVHPPLTAVGRDIPAYGALAARKLLEAIEGAEPGSYEDARPHLTPRGTTAPPRTP
jgi:DNA-binding LacI/PurR family transcriptional regulator